MGLLEWVWCRIDGGVDIGDVALFKQKMRNRILAAMTRMDRGLIGPIGRRVRQIGVRRRSFISAAWQPLFLFDCLGTYKVHEDFTL